MKIRSKMYVPLQEERSLLQIDSEPLDLDSMYEVTVVHRVFLNFFSLELFSSPASMDSGRELQNLISHLPPSALIQKSKRHYFLMPIAMEFQPIDSKRIKLLTIFRTKCLQYSYSGSVRIDELFLPLLFSNFDYISHLHPPQMHARI